MPSYANYFIHMRNLFESSVEQAVRQLTQAFTSCLAPIVKLLRLVPLCSSGIGRCWAMQGTCNPGPKRRRLTKRADAQAAETLQLLHTTTEPDDFDSDLGDLPATFRSADCRTDVPGSVSRLLNSASRASRPKVQRGQLTARGRRRRGSGAAT